MPARLVCQMPMSFRPPYHIWVPVAREYVLAFVQPIARYLAGRRRWNGLRTVRRHRHPGTRRQATKHPVDVRLRKADRRGGLGPAVILDGDLLPGVRRSSPCRPVRVQKAVIAGGSDVGMIVQQRAAVEPVHQPVRVGKLGGYSVPTS